MIRKVLDKNWQNILRYGAEAGASDFHFAAGQLGFVRCEGNLTALGWVDEQWMFRLLDAMLSEAQKRIFEKDHALDFSWECLGRRFRVNAYYQRGKPAVALRLIPSTIPPFEELGLPAALRELLMARNGLILVCGKTGAGKTTTLAAYLNQINQIRAAHIITLEDPIEYVYTPQNCFVSQREYGVDFLSFSSALCSALREDPDVLLVGELREASVVRIALQAAETGILVLSSLHTRNAAEAVLRLCSMFPSEQQLQIRTQLSFVLRGIFSQQLVAGVAGRRVCAVEVLLSTPAVRNLLRNEKYQQLNSVMLSGQSLGMQTLEKAIERLLQNGEVTQETAARCLSERI